ncbi:hypothetical protein D3C72_2217770 [compost metagenome]
MPELALASFKSARLMVFMAVNCVDIAIPSTNSGRIINHSGIPGLCNANWAISTPIINVMPTSVLR